MVAIGLVQVAVAFVLAATAAAAVTGVVSREAVFVKPAFFVALAHASILGAPAYYILRSRGRTPWLWCIGAGSVIGAVPLGLWLLASPMHSAVSGGVATVVDGRRTAAGWAEYFGAVGMLGLHGAVAGLVFWSSLRLLGGGRDRAARGDARPMSRGSVLGVVCGVPVAAAAVVGIFAVDPEQVVDQTCHNPLRGKRRVTVELRAYLRVDLDEWPRIAAAFEDFARANEWSLRRVPTDEQRPLSHHISICDPAGTQIVAWYLPIPAEPRRDERHWGVHVVVYQPQGGESWRAPTRDLLVELRRQWPGQMGFTDDMGHVTDPPDLLAPEGPQPDTAR